MPKFDIDFSYKVKEYNTLSEFEADTIKEAEENALVTIKEFWPEATEIEVETVRELV